MLTKQGNFIQRKAPHAVDSVVLFRPNGVYLTVFYFQVVVIAKKHLRLGGKSGCLQGKVRPGSACVRGSAVVGADLQFRILRVAYGVQVLGGGVHGQSAKKSILATGFRTKLNRGLPVLIFRSLFRTRRRRFRNRVLLLFAISWVPTSSYLLYGRYTRLCI